jgi:hypothetical protein
VYILKNLLLGNGINIQFGGIAYSSNFIMKRIKYRAKLDCYDDLFGNKLTGNEIVNLLENFVEEANKIRVGEYDSFATDDDTIDALKDFKDRYNATIKNAHDIMLEDWFFVVHMFFLKNLDLEENRKSAIQGFERLILDAIFNSGKIQEIYNEMKKHKKVRRFFQSFDNIYTLNYDNNIENLTQKEVYHLHGDFSVLANSENENNVLGYIRTKAGETVAFDEMKHCFCNALLNYSGRLKYKVISDNHRLIVEAKNFADRYANDEMFKQHVEKLKDEKPLEYSMITTKISHPELNMATEYYFDSFSKIEGELVLIGMSPNNDAHIFDAILNNKKLTKVIFHYYDEKDKAFIETHFPKKLFQCEKVDTLWRKLECKAKTYNCNYHLPNQDLEKFIGIFNALSDDVVSKETILKKVNQIPQFEMKRLCKLVKKDMQKRNPLNTTTDEKAFLQQSASISYIALQEGILPSVLYMICIMNFEYIKAMA